MLTGLPKTVIISSEEIRRALDEPVTQIIDAMKSTLDKTPPELAADIMDRGIVLAGGGALLQGLDERVRHETQMPVHLAESPLTCVAVGSGRSLEEFDVDPPGEPQPRAPKRHAPLGNGHCQARVSGRVAKHGVDFRSRCTEAASGQASSYTRRSCQGDAAPDRRRWA